MFTGNQRTVPGGNDQSSGSRSIIEGRMQVDEEEGVEKAIITSYTYELPTQL